MISNLPTLTTRKVTVEIDTALAETQLSRLTDLLQRKDTLITRNERAALDGVRNLLSAMTGAEIKQPRAPTKRMTVEDINRIRDLYMNGITPAGIAKQMDYRPLAIQRVCNGQTYIDVPYEPSEFHLSDNIRWASTNKFPWTEEWNPNDA